LRTDARPNPAAAAGLPGVHAATGGGTAPRIQQIADDLIAVFLPCGHAELVTEIAQPVPMTVIAELLGVPAADRGEFARPA
jgi:cytochrome P450